MLRQWWLRRLLRKRYALRSKEEALQTSIGNAYSNDVRTSIGKLSGAIAYHEALIRHRDLPEAKVKP